MMAVAVVNMEMKEDEVLALEEDVDGGDDRGDNIRVVSEDLNANGFVSTSFKLLCNLKFKGSINCFKRKLNRPIDNNIKGG